MNEQKAPKGIGWTRIVDPDGRVRRGFTWNPTGGCLHACTWRMPDGAIAECYAKTIAERFGNVYKQGFEHHYFRPHEVKAPLKLKTPAGIFVGSMADLFGHWVPEEQIRQVIDVMEEAEQHIFLTLSKYPIRLLEFDPFPKNVWTGVSLPAGRTMSARGAARALMSYMTTLDRVQAMVRFMSIEPLWFDVAPVFREYLSLFGAPLPFEWVIIGAASDGSRTHQPEARWTRDLLRLMDEHGIPVFFKSNLKWDSPRRQFPKRPWEVIDG